MIDHSYRDEAKVLKIGLERLAQKFWLILVGPLSTPSWRLPSSAGEKFVADSSTG
jgi:hypothetical protein